MQIVTDPNPILHQPCRPLSKTEILSPEIRQLIQDLRETSKSGKYGVGLSAVQTNHPVRLSLVAIKPTPNRPNLEPFDKVLINAKITETFGSQKPMWEGCCSLPGPDGKPIYAQIPRYEKIRVKFLDEAATEHEEIFEGFIAEVVQHETDHCDGVMINDLVPLENFISNAEYHKIAMTGQAQN